MDTLFQAPERQYNNYSNDVVVDGSSFAHHNVRLVFDIVTVDAGSFCDFTLSVEREDQSLARRSVRLDSTGQKVVGMRTRYPDVNYHVMISMTGRMRLRVRVVNFDEGEDIPEVIV